MYSTTLLICSIIYSKQVQLPVATFLIHVVLLICFALVIVQLYNVSSTFTGKLDGSGDLLAIFYDEEQMKVTTRSKLFPKDQFDTSLKGIVSKMNNAAKNSIIRDIP